MKYEGCSEYVLIRLSSNRDPLYSGDIVVSFLREPKESTLYEYVEDNPDSILILCKPVKAFRKSKEDSSVQYPEIKEI
jgi:hypothetical protein